MGIIHFILGLVLLTLGRKLFWLERMLFFALIILGAIFQARLLRKKSEAKKEG